MTRARPQRLAHCTSRGPGPGPGPRPGIVLAGLLLLTACGQTGPLFLPDPVDATTGPAQPEEDESDERDDER